MGLKNDAEGCGMTPFNDAMEVHLKRVKWNFKHLLSLKGNPHHEKHRPAWRDTLHSITNIPVEYSRACPYGAGHFFQYVIIGLLIFGIVGWIV